MIKVNNVRMFFIILLGLVMQFLKARDIKETSWSPYTGLINLGFMLAFVILFLIAAGMILANFVLK